MEDNTDILINDLIFLPGKDTSMVDEDPLYKYIINMLKAQLNEDEIKEIVVYLSELYQSSYRHSYSHISSTIYQNISIESGEIESKLDILKNNSDAIWRNGLEKHQEEHIRRGFEKFHDHIALEINRLEDIVKKIKQINNTIEKFREDFSQEMKDTLESSTKKINCKEKYIV